jgi:hypothetical protein
MLMSGRDARGPEDHDRATGVARPQQKSDSIQPEQAPGETLIKAVEKMEG